MRFINTYQINIITYILTYSDYWYLIYNNPMIKEQFRLKLKKIYFSLS